MQQSFAGYHRVLFSPLFITGFMKGRQTTGPRYNGGSSVSPPDQFLAPIGSFWRHITRKHVCQETNKLLAGHVSVNIFAQHCLMGFKYNYTLIACAEQISSALLPPISTEVHKYMQRFVIESGTFLLAFDFSIFIALILTFVLLCFYDIK